MSYQALYRKYRPQTFSDVVGQEHITETLKNELADGKTVHAYLFTGTRGTGKTSCAKILAKAVNCLNPQNGDPCGECEMCKAIADGSVTDICEIDAASNNSVDSIRELREQVSFAPASAKYRVYIIDEVHMLTISAFNALLKTLEEPPAHVIFILATTEVHKLPATILSRCQRFDFRRIEPSKICERINYIADCEGLTVTDDAATLIASAADGGMRDALSILDLCASNNTVIDENVVANVCAMAGNDYLVKLADLIKVRNTEGALLLLDELHNSSVDMLRLLSELIGHFRDLMIIKTVKSGNRPIVCSADRLKTLEKQASNYDIKEIMSVLSVLQSANANMQNGNRRLEMEMTLIKLCNPQISSDLSSVELRLTALENRNVVTKPKTPAVNVTEELPESTDEDIPVPEMAEVTNSDTKPLLEWTDILYVLKKSCPLIAGVLQGSSAYIKGNYLLIDTDNGQFKTMVNGNNPTYRNAIRNAAKEILGVEYKLGPYKKAENEIKDPLAAFAQKLKNLEKN
ncbi:MAG: DNA polymerase III subunit gamma/tau [Clostridia bacterium]|nr:DNA polymerase III subunit gamma/tau [Clostridia bacterium]